MIEYTVKVHTNGDTFWYLNGQLHREDGPAIEWAHGNKSWHLNGKRHREDGPAVERSNGYKAWWLNDKLHREDGPAEECSNGDKLWYLNGVSLTEEEHKEAMNPTVEMTMEEICKALGKTVKVVK
jgi:hypothetical protein